MDKHLRFSQIHLKRKKKTSSHFKGMTYGGEKMTITIVNQQNVSTSTLIIMSQFFSPYLSE